VSLPPTSNRSDWPRLVAQAVNKLINDIAGALTRLTTAETDVGALQTDLTAAQGATTALDGRVTALEGKTAYSVATVTFTPQTAPGSPVAGMTYFDSGTNKLRTYDGTIWNDHW